MNLQPGTRYCFRVRVAMSGVTKPASPWNRSCDATTTEQGPRAEAAEHAKPPPPPEPQPQPPPPADGGRGGRGGGYGTNQGGGGAGFGGPPPGGHGGQGGFTSSNATCLNTPHVYASRPAPTPRRSNGSGSRLGTVRRADGAPDRRYSGPRPVTNAGRPDMRFRANPSPPSRPMTKGGSPDMCFKANRRR
jgi:hypothetical protein